MLFPDKANGNYAPRRDGDRRSEEALEHEDALGVITQCAVPEIRSDRLGFVEPLVERQIVFRLAAPFADRRKRMVITMSHHRLLTIRARRFRTRCTAHYNPAFSSRRSRRTGTPHQRPPFSSPPNSSDPDTRTPTPHSP